MALDRLPTLPSFDSVKDSIQLAHMWNCLISEADRDSCWSQADRCQPHGRNYSFLKLLKGRTNNIVLGNWQESGQRFKNHQLQLQWHLYFLCFLYDWWSFRSVAAYGSMCVVRYTKTIVKGWRDAQLWRVLLVLKRSLVPSKDMRQFTAAYSSALEGSLPPSSFSKYLYTCEQTHTCVETKQINLKPHIQWRFMS